MKIILNQTIFSGFVDCDKVMSYDTNKSQCIAKGTGWGASFADTVQQIEEYISDPMVCALCNHINI